MDTSGSALRAAYQARPALIKINNEELKDIYPELDEESPEDILRILKEVTPHENIIITMGGKGSLAKIGHRFFRIQSPKKETRNLLERSGSFCDSQLSQLFPRSPARAVSSGTRSGFADRR
ncbi:TPA: PfkB family carbohydrate kinase [Streptococcus suis]